MRGKTTSTNSLYRADRDSAHPDREAGRAVAANKPPYIVSPHKLNQLFDSDENDDALFARLKRERQLYREFNGAEHPGDLRRRVMAELERLGFSEYAFLRLNRVDTPTGAEALIPTELLSSYSERTQAQCGLMLQAGLDCPRNRHLSALFHWVASTAPSTLAGKSEQYVLTISDGGTGCYLVSTGLPAGNRLLWMSDPHNPADTQDFRRRLESHEYALNLLATTIEAVGTKRFPALFKQEAREPGTGMTPRPLRLLNTLAKRDATLREAADRLCLSTDTINKHVAAAKSALGTNTLTGTLWRAVQAGLMDTEEL